MSCACYANLFWSNKTATICPAPPSPAGFSRGEHYAHFGKICHDAPTHLIRVNDPHENATWVYNYDRGGNITSKVRYAYTTGTVGTAVETIPYAYSDSNWKDKLTAYNGTAITYDAIGNPLNDGSWTYEWAVGRQLKKMSREGQSLTFKYDHNGMRIQKVLEHSWYPETTNYTYHGKLLTHMEVAYTDFDEVSHVDKLHFFYDAQSRPAKVRFNGTIYTYVHNLQGDIVGILDSTGNLVVEYKYDAWGKPLATTGSLADTLGIRNPFRYRGYIYDEESGLYWLKSRYYCPELCRFISMDALLGLRGGMLTHNSYTYCWNTPTMYNDASGNIPTVDDVKYSFSIPGSIFLFLKGYDISRACYQHFFYGDGKPLDGSLLRKIGSAVSKSAAFKKRILDNAPADKTVWIDKPSEAIEMSGDLYYAIQHITPVSVCIRTSKAIVGISYFSDCYDFEYRSEKQEPDLFKRIVNNNCGYRLQENGYGTNYMINVLFSFYIPLE